MSAFIKTLGKMAVGLALLATTTFSLASPLLLTPSSLGPLPLGRGAKISERQLAKLFPDFIVSYEIGQGDSPDFHYFEVKDKNGVLVFTIKSFIKGESAAKKLDSPVSISILQVYGPQVRDSYGLKVGDRVSDILKKRGKSLEFSAGHHDVSLGAGNVFYNVATQTGESPESLKVEDAVKGNWKIRSISWPTAAWE